MPGTKEIKRRIKSIRNTKKITKAMELVAASKMKRAVASTLASRLYAEYSWTVLQSIAKNVEKIEHPFFLPQESKDTLLVLITSNRGLCGAYNSQVLKKTIQFLKADRDGRVDLITVGKKGDNGMRRLGQNIIASFTELGDSVTLRDISPLSKLLVDEYRAGKYGKILIAYTDFASALIQKPHIRELLPISKLSLKNFIETLVGDEMNLPAPTEDNKIEYLVEGNKDVLISSLAEKITRMQIYQMFLESSASEQSARMMAMKNASEASSEMIDDLTLVFNKARQANITREISEISAGMASVS